MEPLHVTAYVPGQVRITAPIALDALLGYVVATSSGLAPAAHEGELRPIEIPIAREPGGRFYLASFSVCRVAARELRYTNRRFPIAEAQMFGHGIKRLQINAGPSKSFRIPHEALHVENGRLDWFCIGDRGEIAELLTFVPYLGKRRGVGYGRVAEWTVTPCTAWDGFPVMRNGRALRNLPVDWPGLDPDALIVQRAPLDMPYWTQTRAELVAVPEPVS